MIYNANEVDIIGKRKDGGVDLLIISSGPLDFSAETQTLLLDKIQNHLGYLQSDEFKSEFPSANKYNTWIILSISEKAPRMIYKFAERIVPWVNKSGANFKIETGVSNKVKPKSGLFSIFTRRRPSS